LILIFSPMKVLIPFVLFSATGLGVFAANENTINLPKSARDEVTPVPASTAKTEAKRHPLRGVITAVHADRSAIMVKHEAIPGVMGAMTMLFKVDAATLKSAEKGQAITGLMSRQGDDWWLHEVKRADTKKK
jgi:Cu/Ag efflux protein CusF